MVGQTISHYAEAAVEFFARSNSKVGRPISLG